MKQEEMGRNRNKFEEYTGRNGQINIMKREETGRNRKTGRHQKPEENG